MKGPSEEVSVGLGLCATGLPRNVEIVCCCSWRETKQRGNELKFDLKCTNERDLNAFDMIDISTTIANEDIVSSKSAGPVQ